jgi:energy-converting hydrogenase Eha subunit B
MPAPAGVAGGMGALASMAPQKLYDENTYMAGPANVQGAVINASTLNPIEHLDTSTYTKYLYKTLI